MKRTILLCLEPLNCQQRSPTFDTFQTYRPMPVKVLSRRLVLFYGLSVSETVREFSRRKSWFSVVDVALMSLRLDTLFVRFAVGMQLLLLYKVPSSFYSCVLLSELDTRCRTCIIKMIWTMAGKSTRTLRYESPTCRRSLILFPYFPFYLFYFKTTF